MQLSGHTSQDSLLPCDSLKEFYIGLCPGPPTTGEKFSTVVAKRSLNNTIYQVHLLDLPSLVFVHMKKLLQSKCFALQHVFEVFGKNHKQMIVNVIRVAKVIRRAVNPAMTWLSWREKTCSETGSPSLSVLQLVISS